MRSAAPTDAPIDPEAAWRQLLARDPEAGFYYAVSTTGVFCRPSCSSRRPLRANVRFFPTSQAARAAGFRPCQRCRPESPDPAARLRTHIEANLDRPVPLAELAQLVSLSPFTVQRLFKRSTGLSPLAWQRALRAARLRQALKQGESVTRAIYTAGFGSSRAAYEPAPLGMTPARFAKGGRGEQIGFATAPSPFGWIVVGATGRGICWLALGSSAQEAEASLRAEFPLADLHPDPALAASIDLAVSAILGTEPIQDQEKDLRGTAFQLKVWQALTQIPRGQTRTYSQLARDMGLPNSTRAVARACATNRVSLLVPCHRVVGVSGSLTGYRWGIDRKRRLLEAESAPQHSSAAGQSLSPSVP